MRASAQHGYLLGLAACLLCAGCDRGELSSSSEVIVIIDADEALKSQLGALHVDVLDEAGKHQSASHQFELAGVQALPLSFGVYRVPDGAEWFMLSTRGVDRTGNDLVRHKVIAHFEARQVSHLQIRLDSACALKFCDDSPDQTCDLRTGQCAPIPGADRPDPTDSDPGPITSAGEQDGGAAGAAGQASPVDAGTSTGATTTGDSDQAVNARNGFATLRQSRGDGTITVHEEAFEQSARLCTVDGRYCVTGAFEP